MPPTCEFPNRIRLPLTVASSPPSQVRYQTALQPVAEMISHRGSPYSVAHSEGGRAHAPRVRFMTVLMDNSYRFI
ncbi:hypothetical protein CS0771_45900 [Catellatospora sp. IY07-71]|nr:hypothetical protein CS0771_45900 [Catellatospora sp. IY07-71]